MAGLGSGAARLRGASAGGQDALLEDPNRGLTSPGKLPIMGQALLGPPRYFGRTPSSGEQGHASSVTFDHSLFTRHHAVSYTHLDVYKRQVQGQQRNRGQKDVQL